MRRPVLLAIAAACALASGATAEEGREARVTLDAKDADIHAIVGALVEAPGLQAVFDRGITCKLTVAVRTARWLEVFQTALAACGLGYEEDGTLVRIATRATLAQEAADRRRLAEEVGRVRSNRVVLFRLSYARAREMAPLLKKHLAHGGDVTYDERTNTLIIVD